MGQATLEAIARVKGSHVTSLFLVSWVVALSPMNLGVASCLATWVSPGRGREGGRVYGPRSVPTLGDRPAASAIRTRSMSRTMNRTLWRVARR